MITLIASVVLFLFIWRTRKDLEATVSSLTRRIEALESLPVPGTTRGDAAPAVVVPPPPVAPAPPRNVSPPAFAATVREPAFRGVETEAHTSNSLETEIGSRWLLYVGVVALIVGAAYFQKLAIDNNWIGERARVIEGIFAGLLMVAGGRWFIGRGYDVYGQIVAGGGVAVLYVSVYAASTLYALIGRGAAFGALCAVTSLAAALADRYRSQGLAVMAVGGGFLTPFLLPSARDAQAALFTYIGVLITGTMYLAHRRVWPLLNVLSYVFTHLAVAAWAVSFYTASRYLVTEAYLTLFCAMFLYILFQLRRADAPWAQAAQVVLWTAPVVYYVQSLAVLGPHSIALLVFLGIVASIGAALTPHGHAPIRLVVWFAVAAPLLFWSATHAEAAWLVPGLIAVSGIYVVNLLAHLYGVAHQERLAESDIGMLHLNPLVLYAAAHWLVAGVHPTATSALAFGFAIWNGAIAGAVWRRRRAFALHFAAVAATLVAAAIALEFDGAARTIGWSAEGAAVIWIGLREGRRWFHLGGLLVFSVAVLQLLLLLPFRPPTDYVVVLNARAACALFVVALLYLLAWVHRSALVGRLGATPFVLAANVVTLMLVTTEITSYWHVRGVLTPESAGRLGRELMLSVSWALYATALIIVGLRRGFAPIRYLAMVVFALTITKVFLFDLAELDQIYRVSSIVALGVLLLLTSYLYNRRRRKAD